MPLSDGVNEVDGVDEVESASSLLLVFVVQKQRTLHENNHYKK